jgi:FtsH-binding integral membrane protein
MPIPWSRRLFFVLLLLFEPEWRALAGRAGLGRVFWVYGVLMSAGLGLLYLLAREARRLDVEQMLLLLLLGYTGLILVAVWRCAGHAAPPWGQVARALTVAWALNALLLIGFLQVDLLAAWLGGPAP